ncbi:MAG: hypothetical protein DRH24_14200 [Deltaproteobacteria bacterium]|nr:MAG: hypothetical protein DRH24_14200 [Deltaproteobacteria bacterium]
MDIEHIKEILASPAGKELKEFLIEMISRVENINNLKELDNPQELAIELKANKKASVILRDILSQILTIEQSKGRTEEDKQKDKYY